MDDDDHYLEETQKWLEGLQKGVMGYDMELINLETLKVLQIQKGLLRCSFTVTNRVSDKDGNWHPGAIATLIDNLGGAVIHTISGLKKASVEFSVSFYAKAKIQEVVVLESKIVGEKGRITSVVVEVRRKDNGELIALGKQWMTANNIQTRTSSKL